ncbi:MAG: GNAT family N-acetyltransferase [Gaiellaceae bacterium]
MRSFVRPDGRRFVRDPDEQSLSGLEQDAYCTSDERDVDRLTALGFLVNRREGEYVLPTRVSPSAFPAGIRVARGDEVEERALRLLDDELRQDVPGSDGWTWDEAGFREETYESPHFDPATYLVAVDEGSGDLVGIVRVWMRPGVPTLGFIGVARSHRQHGLGRALVTSVLAELEGRGIPEVTTSIDDTNVASRGLLEGLGARRTGTSVELIKRHPAAVRRSL